MNGVNELSGRQPTKDNGRDIIYNKNYIITEPQGTNQPKGGSGGWDVIIEP